MLIRYIAVCSATVLGVIAFQDTAAQALSLHECSAKYQAVATAARKLGWPQQIVDATRAQMQGITEMQIQMMDQMMNAWEEQIKSPSPSSAILSKLKSWPALSPAGSWPSSVTSQMAAFNPFGVYMQIAQQWQKACADTMAFWTKADEPNSWRAKL
jgi:hypothetical protein